MKGPWPRIAPQSDNPATASNAVLAPPGPNRTAAHSSSGNGRNTSAGTEFAPCQPNTDIPTANMLAPNNPASATRRREACCHHSLPRVAHNTAGGVTSAIALTFESAPRHQIDQSGPAPVARNIESTNDAETKDTRQ